MRVAGLGSMPGSDFREATRMVAELTPELLAWPELPQRDAASEMIGRTLGLLDQPCNLSPDGWRLASRADAAQQRAARWWRHDMDDFDELTEGHQGTVKVALAGPWTLATAVRLSHPTMNHVIADAGACRDLAQALAQAASQLISELVTRLDRPVIVQIDEPAIGLVLGASVPTFSGLHRYRRPEVDEVLASWRLLVDAVAGIDRVSGSWLHSCGPGFEIDLAGRAGFTGLAIDADQLDPHGLDQIGRWLDAGGEVGLGVVPTDQLRAPSRDQILLRTLGLLRPLGLDPDLLATSVVLTPACGLGTWPVDQARLLLAHLAAAGRTIDEELRRTIDEELLG